ncbi:YycH family regulatory protein [Pontibacillus litoralis]|uniref:Regulatory protein YycH domain-containing protein n=1 Tax=Pontibacillus litoralis JSM 072002 TaxID=1385512 RepID=A0A0A5G152_9BACI|nr:two-component system activity regulator YycH [Pontibacillus litoralis]KGX84833.1 hypothetical protein N784_11695 [Pontibacillus litoralis JSM 072002]
MTIETIKSIVLTMLIATSLLLTLAIWNYKPNYEALEDNSVLNAKTKIDGKQESLSGIIEPKEIIFHEGGDIYALASRQDSLSLYEAFRQWPLDEFESVPKQTLNRKSSLEIIYPTSVPLSVLASTLTLNEDDQVIPEFMVDRIFVDISADQTLTNVYFYSDEDESMYNATIRNFEAYKELVDYINDPSSHLKYLSIGEEEERPIYIPAGQIKLPKYTYTTYAIGENPLINVLFDDPNKVRENQTSVGQSIYTDDRMQMQLCYNKEYMRFTNPSVQPESSMTYSDLIRESMRFINDHHGWTDNYNLYDIDATGSTVKYRLQQNGYPVFNEKGLSAIEQTWYNQELFRYKRSLFQLATPIENDSTKTLALGEQVDEHLAKSRTQYPLLIDDITIGYTMEVKNQHPFIVTFEPAWYYKTVGGNWRPVFEEPVNQGGTH